MSDLVHSLSVDISETIRSQKFLHLREANRNLRLENLMSFTRGVVLPLSQMIRISGCIGDNVHIQGHYTMMACY